MKAIAASLLILGTVLTMHFAGASTGDRPAGVEERNWIPVSDKMGFVVMTPRFYPPVVNDAQALRLRHPRKAISWFALCDRDCRNGSKNASFEIRKGEGGCLFDEIHNLVEPTERRYKNVSAGPQRGRS
jgi:hypothetical protein